MWKLVLALVPLAAVCLLANGSDYQYDGFLINPNIYERNDFRPSNRSHRTAITKGTWTDGIIPYAFTADRCLEEKFTSKQKELIADVMAHIEKHTCIKFRRKRVDDESFIQFIESDDCNTYLGMADGMNPIFLHDDCFHFGLILHELCHVIGLYHEHRRPDRDNFVEIFDQNIKPSMMSQFDRLDPSEVLIIDSFDYDSIMMYGEHAFAKEPGLKTMIAKKPGVKLVPSYKKKQLSIHDIYRINYLYLCQ